jgi:hypothetical protein
MSDEFHEEWPHPDADPDRSSTPFDWDSVEGGDAPDISSDDMRRLTEAFLRVVQWQLRGIDKPSPGGTKGKARTIGIRAIALAYALNPAILGGKRNAAVIARELGVSRKTMSVTIASARKSLWAVRESEGPSSEASPKGR